ncbi:glyoxylase-like metal-dependent hydrolase (beta-lactamase superfamily II) [Hamadaea flava]|uniref:MBL fold metallo-hydrolase n=1 Tax=Hamadaea flava TaxID=1742688 RepID=A0ABV8M0X9_9ACTN|nr:MBL fold metallo-hydrolase [Hamadaea flava]MCP2328542.1 glyoxylase-like metal-dependent hydrolase (beta-lactamase superfamily II) [Hamadaea flava]
MITFTEIADRVLVAVEPIVNVNVTLIVGDGQALLIDTLSHDGQAKELLAAVRGITGDPLTVVNTHHHYDHAFGNAVVAAGTGGGRPPQDAPIWAHVEAAALLRDQGPVLQRQWYEELLPQDPAFADALGQCVIRPPDQIVHNVTSLDVGGRVVVLRHLGRGHTIGDLVAEVPDVDVVVAGDLVEEGAPPGFGDSYPISWPDTLAALLTRLGPQTRVVPGHGAVVGPDFAQAQHSELSQLSWLIREAHGDGGDPLKVARNTTLARFGDRGLKEAQLAVVRGYEELEQPSNTH